VRTAVNQQPNLERLGTAEDDRRDAEIAEGRRELDDVEMDDCHVPISRSSSADLRALCVSAVIRRR
jgi:hypothetical protein